MSFATVNNQDALPLASEEPSKPTYKSYKYGAHSSSCKKPHIDNPLQEEVSEAAA